LKALICCDKVNGPAESDAAFAISDLNCRNFSVRVTKALGLSVRNLQAIPNQNQNALAAFLFWLRYTNSENREEAVRNDVNKHADCVTKKTGIFSQFLSCMKIIFIIQLHPSTSLF
jgi:hypothetical protein